jgi:hypothetical protein
MFLDEELYQIGHKFNGSNDIELIKEMIDVCLNRLSNELNQAQDDDIIPVCLRRINASWNMAVNKLAKEDKKITIKDGFLLFLLHSDSFKILRPFAKQLI